MEKGTRWSVNLTASRCHFIKFGSGQVEVSITSGYAEVGSPLPLSHRVLWLLGNINSDVSMLCSVVYWPFLYNQEPLSFHNLSGHGLITIINILDVLISDRWLAFSSYSAKIFIFRPWRCLHAYQVQLFCLIYVLSNFAYVEGGGTNIADQPYIYSILNWNQPFQLIEIYFLKEMQIFLFLVVWSQSLVWCLSFLSFTSCSFFFTSKFFSLLHF